MTDSKTERQEVRRETLTPPNLPLLYVNGFQVALGPTDVRLNLIETSPSGPTKVVDKHLMSIVMSPETLKLLSEYLPSFVETFEKEFGKIRDVGEKRQRVIAPIRPHS